MGFLVHFVIGKRSGSFVVALQNVCSKLVHRWIISRLQEILESGHTEVLGILLYFRVFLASCGMLVIFVVHWHEKRF